MTVARLVNHYDTIHSTLTEPPSPEQRRGRSSKQHSYSGLRLNIRKMFTTDKASTRSMSANSTDSSSTSGSPLATTFESPASTHASPTFMARESRYHGTHEPHHMNSLPAFSMSNLHSFMSSSRSSSRQPSRQWYSRRALSQTDLALESERHADGIEGVGLGLFEPRPHETTVSRASTTGSMVLLDGISEIMHSR